MTGWRDFLSSPLSVIIGKHITVNYMMAKDSVKKRFDPNENTEGMSFTEFSYQLLQGFEFPSIYTKKKG